MKAPYTQFDLPTRHLVGTKHYIPARARDSSEIDRRHSLPTGTVLLEQQHRGIQVFRDVLRAVSDANDIAFTAELAAVCGLNSASYQFGGVGKVMRKQTTLPYYARPIDQVRPTSDERLEIAQAKIERVADVAGTLATLRAERKPGQPHYGKLLGRMMADTALEIVCAPIANDVAHADPFTTQALLREHSLATLDRARNLSLEIGTPPSFAQLADQDSDLSVHIRRTAPTDVFYAFDQAMTAHAMPR